MTRAVRGWQRGRQPKNPDIYQTKVEHTDQINGSYGTDPDSFPTLTTTKHKLSVSFNSNKQTSNNHIVKKGRNGLGNHEERKTKPRKDINKQILKSQKMNKEVSQYSGIAE